MFSSNSTPESSPKISISSDEITETGSAVLIEAPLICEPSTTTSSSCASPCASANELVKENPAINANPNVFLNKRIISP